MAAGDTNNLSKMDGSGIRDLPLPVALALGQSLSGDANTTSHRRHHSSTCVRGARCSHGSWDRREREWDGDLSSYNSENYPIYK